MACGPKPVRFYLVSMSAQQALALALPAASDTVVINARCSLRLEADQRVVVVGGLPVHHYRSEDALAEAYAMVFLVESGFAQRRSADRCAPCVGSKIAMNRAGWQRSVGKRAGVAVDDASLGSVCAASRC